MSQMCKQVISSKDTNKGFSKESRLFLIVDGILQDLIPKH